MIKKIINTDHSEHFDAMCKVESMIPRGLIVKGEWWTLGIGKSVSMDWKTSYHFILVLANYTDRIILVGDKRSIEHVEPLSPERKEKREKFLQKMLPGHDSKTSAGDISIVTKSRTKCRSKQSIGFVI